MTEPTTTTYTDTTPRTTTSTVRRVPSVRALGAWDGLVPDGWWMDEWRGGNCAAVVTTVTIDGETWEVAILPDDTLRIPHVDETYLTWRVFAGRYLEDEGGELVPGYMTFDGRYHHEGLVLPAYVEGEAFPTGLVVGWLAEVVRQGQVILV